MEEIQIWQNSQNPKLFLMWETAKINHKNVKKIREVSHDNLKTVREIENQNFSATLFSF